MLKTILCVLFFTSVSLTDNIREFPSPDRANKAIIQNYREGGECYESGIRIVGAGGRILFNKSYTSPDGEHGFCIVQAAWTSDSRFFVFSMNSLGSLQPWHHPTVVYSVKDSTAFFIDRLFAPVTAGFTLLSSDSLKTSILVKGSRMGKPIIIFLPDLPRIRKQASPD